MSEQSNTSTPAAPAQQQPPAAPAPTRAPIAFGRQGIELATLEDAYRFANAVAASGFAPKGMDKPESIMVAIQLGAELGLTPMSALQNIGVINGRPGIYGDAALALVRSSGLLESYEQAYTGDGDKLTCKVTARRKGDPVAITTEFSVGDAKAAGLWGKQGPWSQYPRRMLLFRSRGFTLRDGFGDVLKGLRTTEELADIPAEINVTPGGAVREARVPAGAATMLDLEAPASAQAAPAQTETPTTSGKPEAGPADPAVDLAPTESPAEHLVRLAAQAGIQFDQVEAWAAARRLNASKDADAQKIINAWSTVARTLQMAGGAA
ncbi:MAG: hypothetical protein IPL39_16150 [Opitutaceae bacterium]|nr:hypothetical protein [Opitutaceae bacterium]